MSGTIVDANYVIADTTTPPESVDLSTPENVAWAFRKLRDAKSRIAEERATATALTVRLQQEIQQVEDHFENVTKPDRETAAYMENQLAQHLLARRAADDSVKSIATPWGDVTSRVQPPEFKRDDVILKEWASHDGRFWKVHITETPDWEALKKACHVQGQWLVTPEGEVIPGVEVIERGPRVSVEVVE